MQNIAKQIKDQTDSILRRRQVSPGASMTVRGGTTTPGTGPGTPPEVVDPNRDLAAYMGDYVRSPGFAWTTSDEENTYKVATIPPLPALVDGASIYVVIHIDNTNVSTLNWDDTGPKPIMDSMGNGMTAGKLKAGIVYGLRYIASAEVFQLLGEGGGVGEAGEGNATNADLLLGKTATSENGPLVGTMPNHGEIVITPSDSQQPILIGYYSGGHVEAQTPRFKPHYHGYDFTPLSNYLMLSNILAP